MGVCWMAINSSKEEYFRVPNNWGNKGDQIYQDLNPFPRMLCYALHYGDWSGDSIDVIGDCFVPDNMFDEDEKGCDIWTDITDDLFKALKCHVGSDQQYINIKNNPKIDDEKQ